MWTIGDIQCANMEAGWHWFDEDTMRFFNSIVYPEVCEGPGGIFFVSSEQWEHHAHRRFTVRRFNPDTGTVDTHGEFMGYDTRSGAYAGAWEAANVKSHVSV